MATFTAAAALPGVSPKAYQTGVQCEVFSHGGTASIAAGDVVLGCKIPHGATVLDCAVKLFHKADTQVTLNPFVAKVGDGSGTAIFSFGSQVTSSTAGSVLFRPGNSFAGPTKISLSDDATFRYAMFKVGITAGTTTTSFSMNGYVLYTMDES